MVNGFLRVDCLVNALRCDLGHPNLDRLGLLGGDRLNNAEHQCHICDISSTSLPIFGNQFQPVTFCNQFTSFLN